MFIAQGPQDFTLAFATAAAEIAGSCQKTGRVCTCVSIGGVKISAIILIADVTAIGRNQGSDGGFYER